MTETEELAWEASQQAIVQELAHLSGLLAAIPDAMPYTATRNRLDMAMRSLETARDQLSAARDRYTEAQDKQGVV